MWSAHEETNYEYSLDLSLGIAFSLISLISIFRLVSALPSLKEYFKQSGGGHVISAFYFLILLTSLLRSIWFLIPSETVEGSYVPVMQWAYSSKHWIGTLTSEILLSLGSLSLFSIFILMAAFWAHMLRRVDINNNSSNYNNNNMINNYSSSMNMNQYEEDDDDSNKMGPIQSFAVMMAIILAVQCINFVCFLMRVYDSTGMILFDSIYLSVVSSATLIQFWIFSSRFLHVLETIAAINANSTIKQRNRIFSITITANCFFALRVALEITLSVVLIGAWKHNQKFSSVLSHSTYWDTYIAIKHWSEVVVLSLSLLISLSVGGTGREYKDLSIQEANFDMGDNFDNMHVGSGVNDLRLTALGHQGYNNYRSINQHQSSSFSA